MIYYLLIPLLSFFHSAQTAPRGSAPAFSDYCSLYGSVYVEEDRSRAQYFVYMEESEAFADLVVYKEENKLFADRTGLWHFAKSRNFADFTIYFVNHRSEADFSIYYTESLNFAGCN